MSSDLDGATAPPPDAMMPGTPGEFAARWNAASEERRAEWLEAVNRFSADAARCFMANHDAEVAQLRERVLRLEAREAVLLSDVKAAQAAARHFEERAAVR